MEYNFEVGSGVDRYAIAKEVIISASNILSAAGFWVSEIRALFEETTIDEVIDTDIGVGLTPSNGWTETSNLGLRYQLEERFRQQDFYVSLERSAKRLNILHDLSAEGSLAKVTAIVIDALPNVKLAQIWITKESRLAGLKVAGCRDEWIAAASDSDLDHEDEMVFLDDHHFAGPVDLYLMQAICKRCEKQANAEPIHALLKQINKTEVRLNSAIATAFQDAVTSISIYAQFCRFLKNFRGVGEQLESELLSSFTQSIARPDMSYLCSNWINSF